MSLRGPFFDELSSTFLDEFSPNFLDELKGIYLDERLFGVNFLDELKCHLFRPADGRSFRRHLLDELKNTF